MTDTAPDDEQNCSQVLRELYVYLDGELTEARRDRIQHHLHDCSHCLEAFDFEAEIRIVVAQKCRDEVPESLMRRVAEAIQPTAGEMD